MIDSTYGTYVLNVDAGSENDPPGRTYPPCRRSEGIAPPACCQPPLEERTARLEAARARAEATTPACCPNCGSPLIRRQDWLDARTWCCEEPDCFAVFSEGD